MNIVEKTLNDIIKKVVKNTREKERYREKLEASRKRSREKYHKNKEYYILASKNYRNNNKEKRNLNSINYKQTYKGRKVYRISRWKARGLIEDDYDFVYDRYMNTTKCDLCYIELNTNGVTATNKCMDHNHKTGRFRGIVCVACNNSRLLRQY